MNFYWISTFIKILLLLLPVLLSVAFLTLLESNVLAAIQLSIGCSTVGIYGFLQPFADALNLLSNEIILPNYANLSIFLTMPILSLALSLMAWFVLPFSTNSSLASINLSLIYVFAVSTVSVYSILMSGWASNSNYSFFGALSACGQMISYEVCVGLILMTIILSSNSLNLTKIVESQELIWFVVPLFPTFILFFISALAETSSVPFDFPEAESELVSGYNVEYSSITFVFFFLAEYCHIILMSALIVLLFLGGWQPILNLPFVDHFWFPINILVIVLAFIWVSAVLPSFSYDNLMSLLWNVFLPLSFGYLIFIFTFFLLFDLLPFSEC